MPFKFAGQPLKSGLYEPEGIYLNLPFAGDGVVMQPFGTHASDYGRFTYNGVALMGHNGVDFGVTPSAQLLAVDDGRVVEISFDPGGLKRYIKVEHRWGESLYALIADAGVDSGQSIARGAPLGRADSACWQGSDLSLLHFGVRITPFNRFDGWGGFANPLLFLNPSDLIFADSESVPTAAALPHTMKAETSRMRRP